MRLFELFSVFQFVPFREFMGGRYGSNPATCQAYLAKEVLAEVPDQVTGYMKKHGVVPKPPPAYSAPPAVAGGAHATVVIGGAEGVGATTVVALATLGAVWIVDDTDARG